jgi:hypothetical protein
LVAREENVRDTIREARSSYMGNDILVSMAEAKKLHCNQGFMDTVKCINRAISVASKGRTKSRSWRF